MEAEHNAPVCESGEVVIDARPEIVWATLTDVGSWPDWMPGVKAVHVDGPLRVGSTFQWKAGPGTIRSEVLEHDPPRGLAWKGRTLGITAVHVWRMDAQEATTRVFTEESWAGPLARALPGLMGKMVRKALDDALPALKHEAERRTRS
ncbi:MAG TPA: SRPBCC family protein [Acidimicrobiales bacterium]|nr:SRPBCC family protein [Acidimicrobiales bacterium]